MLRHDVRKIDIMSDDDLIGCDSSQKREISKQKARRRWGKKLSKFVVERLMYDSKFCKFMYAQQNARVKMSLWGWIMYDKTNLVHRGMS